MRLLAAVALMFSAGYLLGATTREDTGAVNGIVIYEDGTPASGATVYASPMDRAMAGIVPHAETDQTGHIAIDHLWFGKFAVAAKKEDEAYADMSKQFYGDGRFETVILTARNPEATVKIRLGPKAGILVGTVADAVTGVPLNPCVDFRRTSEPDNFLLGTGLVNAKYRVLVPSNTDISMTVWHDGYKAWYYPGTINKSESKPVRLKPGEELTLNIRLQPGSDAAEQGCGMAVGTVVRP